MANRRRSGDSQGDIVVQLRELIEALDRRVPHIERASEAQLALDAMALRANAVRRVAALQSASEMTTCDLHQAEAVMTDDGGPTSVE
jgi:hypothetical protein